MKWQEIVRQLYALHETRKQMARASIYHQTYIDEAVRLNTRLKKTLGKNYDELPKSIIEACLNA